MGEEKKKYLFYYKDEVEAWIPAPEKSENIINGDDYDENEIIGIDFTVFLLTETQFKNLSIEQQEA